MTLAPMSNVRSSAPVQGAGVQAAAELLLGTTGGNRAVATEFVSATRTVVGGGGGPEIKERFDTLVARFKPEAAKGVDARFHFEISGPKGGEWFVEIKDGKITVKKGGGANPTVTLKASDEDYKKIANGEMNKTIAFLRGKLKIDGDKDAMKKFDSYFKELDGTHAK